MRTRTIALIALACLAAHRVVAFQDAGQLQGMHERDFIDVDLAALQFLAGVNVLILAAYGFIASRSWPEGSDRPTFRHPISLVFGGLVVVAAIGLTGWEYVQLGQAASSSEIADYARHWGWRVFGIFAAQAVAVISVAIHARP